jgi:haloalkane dehalogenase
MSAGSWRAAKRYAQVLGRRMAYVEQGQGEPIVFLHGNPTSSFLWRSVLTELVSLGRCIAPDLIGMGDSEKLPPGEMARYTFLRHRDFLDALLDELGVNGQVTLVIHDWGSALGFDWARRNPGRGARNRLHGGDRAAVRRLGRLAAGSPARLPVAAIAGR